jgi:muconolactone delta-isomerase
MSHRNTDRYTDADFEPVLPAETARVRQLYAEDVIRQIWLRKDEPGACFLVEADALGTVHAIVATLPMATSRLSEFTVIPLLPYGSFGP